MELRMHVLSYRPVMPRGASVTSIEPTGDYPAVESTIGNDLYIVNTYPTSGHPEGGYLIT